VKDSHFVHPHPHPPPSKGEGIICCYYKRFSYPLCQVRVKLSLIKGGEGGLYKKRPWVLPIASLPLQFIESWVQSF